MVLRAALVLLLAVAAACDRVEPMWTRVRTHDYRRLIPATEPTEVRAAARDFLEGRGVVYRIDRGAVWVESSAYDRVVLDLYAKGMIGDLRLWEWLQEQGGYIGDRERGRWSAIRRRIERAVTVLDTIEAARVEIPIPRRVRLGKPQPPVRVVVRCRTTSGQELSKRDRRVILGIVGGAIPDLSPDDVTMVVD